MTYDIANSESCISGEYGPTGGTDLLLQWIDQDILPAVMAKLNMTLGEVSITGGSLGGLTSCYAVSARPDLFSRAVCSSPSNCFNTGQMATEITANYAATGKAPKTVIQFLGSVRCACLFDCAKVFLCVYIPFAFCLVLFGCIICVCIYMCL